jgi:hypothetical protein
MSLVFAEEFDRSSFAANPAAQSYAAFVKNWNESGNTALKPG